MKACPSCRREIPPGSRFCPACGAAAPAGGGPASRGSLEDAATVPSPAPGAGTPTPSSRSGISSGAGLSTSTPDGAFASGTIVTERYRIVGLLGRGGMGDVYRADDLTLGQSVALKFLPLALARDPDRRTRFLNEVRTAREVAHPNVCRVYDFGEVDGHAFLSMEFVDGEDLSSLLRRIGRLPQEKAVEIARQLCAGLGALHDRGVLHRDLKPANVMVDGRGRVRITDFGLAGAAGGAITGAEARAGTPAYMAPEQLDGERVDERSDLWALGLVLYEIFTGKRAFEADTVADLQRKQRETTPTSVTSLLPDLDPAIERVIARCLDRDPERRPASAFSVAAALPGGDPIAAALAAGEIPSVEMVAAAGEAGGLRPWVATISALAVLVGIVLVASWNLRGRITYWDPLEKPPAVLADRARGLLEAEGYGETPASRKWGFSRQGAALTWMMRNDSTSARWSSLREARPAGVAFWYREAAEPMVPRASQGGVQWEDPPATEPGMVRVALDTKGRLLYLSVVPPDRDPALPDSGAAPTSELDAAERSEAPPEADWSRLLAAAGVDRAGFEATEPEWLPLQFADDRRAWVGEWPEWPGREIRIEAASLRGQPVIFRVLGPWQEPRGIRASTNDTSDLVGEAVIIVVIFSILLSALFLAVRNLRLHRGDRAGATRLAVFVFGTAILIWLLTFDHVPDPDQELQKLLDFAAQVAFVSGLFWAFYLALEPYVRKTMPERIVSWSRLLTGRWKDPLVGRDILVGGVFFLFLTVADTVRILIPALRGNALPRPGNVSLEILTGPLEMLGGTIAALVNSIFYAMLFFLCLLLARILFRNVWIAAAVYMIAFVAFVWFTAPGGEKAAYVVLGALIAVAWMVMLVRFGLLAFMVGFFFDHLLSHSPLTTDFSAWWSGTGVFQALVVVAITIWGFWSATAGRPLLADRLDD